MSDYFRGIIGQEKVKKKLGLYIDGYRKTSLLPNLLLEGAQGSGKTHLCLRVAELLEKDCLEINGSTVKNPKTFVENVLLEMQGSPTLVFIDELHALPFAVENLLLSVTNPTKLHKKTIVAEGMDIEIDDRIHSFIFATTETQKVFKPLLGRMTTVSLAEYTRDELAQIIMLNADVDVEPDALLTLADYTRGTARSATLMGQELTNYTTVFALTEFDESHVPVLMDLLDIFPLGLTEQEVSVLSQIRDSNGGITLTALASKTNRTKQSQQDIELYLQKKGLMRIDGKRIITQEGVNYLKGINR